ncbi:MAG: hypothetical protein ACI9VT_003707, partial [Psychroserpens sp.]
MWERNKVNTFYSLSPAPNHWFKPSIVHHLIKIEVDNFVWERNKVNTFYSLSPAPNHWFKP